MAKIIKKWREKFSIKSKQEDHVNVCKCPVCKIDLTVTNKQVGTSEFTKYVCENCKTNTKWLFREPSQKFNESDADELLKIWESIDNEVRSTMNLIDNKLEVILNMTRISIELKRMKDILDKY